MNSASIGMMGVLILAGALFTPRVASFSAGFGDRLNNQFTGEITDSLCAESGAHAKILKGNRNNAKAACVLACVNLEGAQFVLYDKRSRQTYKLDDQVQPEAYAGQRVIVTGAYDQATKTIRVRMIRPLIENAF